MTISISPPMPPSTLRVSHELGISQSRMVLHIHNLGKSIWSCQIVPCIYQNIEKLLTYLKIFTSWYWKVLKLNSAVLDNFLLIPKLYCLTWREIEKDRSSIIVFIQLVKAFFIFTQVKLMLNAQNYKLRYFLTSDNYTHQRRTYFKPKQKSCLRVDILNTFTFQIIKLTPFSPNFEYETCTKRLFF